MRVTTQIQPIFFFCLSILSATFLSAQCSLVVSSTDGYDVNIVIEPVNIIAPSTCPGGYNFNVDLDYNISFTGSNIPSSLWTFQGILDCGSHNNMFFPLPNNGGTGTSTTTTNPFRGVADCSTATPESLECEAIDLTIQGPGITTTALTCPVAYSSGALPVELVSFSGESTDEGVKLQWETESELDNDYFLVQHSNDGITWVDIEKITGMGTSFIRTRYNFIDKASLSGIAYYRLQQTDFDGQFELSKVVPVEINGNGQTYIFPNPAKERITINQLRSDEAITVFNAFGKIISVENSMNVIADGIVEVDISTLPAGVYFLKTRNESLKFTKL